MIRLKGRDFYSLRGRNDVCRKNCLVLSPWIILILGICVNLSGALGDGRNDDGKSVSGDLGTIPNLSDPIPKVPGTALTPDPIATLLVVSTLDGSLTALDRLSGQRRWTTKDEPMIRVPAGVHRDSENIKAPFFLPDPRSGSLYILGGHGQLKKLPFTIPQLVSMAPCRSSEGLLYTGRKTDMWLSLDPLTGEKSEIVSFGDSSDGNWSPANASPITGGQKSLLIGKTEYTISMVDGPRKWNVTFHDYTSIDMSTDLIEGYELVHFTSPSTGTILTYEKDSGQLLWQSELQSPVISLYSIDDTLSNLLSIPFTSVASETLNRIKTPAKARDNSQLSPTLYVGQCPYGLYAVSSLVDDTVLTISSGAKFPYLIAGPPPSSPEEIPETKPIIPDDPVVIDTDNKVPFTNSSDDFVILGHYDVPENVKPPAKQITADAAVDQIGRNDSDKIIKPDNYESSGEPSLAEELSHVFPPTPAKKPSKPNPIGTSANVFPPRIEKLKSKNEKEKPFLVLTTAIVTVSIVAVFAITNKEVWSLLVIKISLIATIFSLFGYIWLLIVLDYIYPSVVEPWQPVLIVFAITSTVMSVGFVTFRKFQWKKPPKRFLSGSDGTLTVGKISFDPTAVLGKGCEGTFVFKGKFDGRDVAVKRILPECFEFADREVDLLKESDQHANVIRYFCTEADGQFRYIALELCSATLSDWIEGKFVHEGVKPMDVLKEATDGLAYLHSLRIVHRDCKPQNVLLSVCHTSNVVRTMISDFGLCKKLANGRVSFSRRSGGIPGTEGWIAPEMMQSTERTTYAVDIFSLGCVYYYVLTKGGHPFGDALRRQSNIITGEHSFEDLENCQGALELIKLMISFNAAERPPISAIVSHPMFWSKEKILVFFLDVSDRIEKEVEATCEVLRRLETNAVEVARGDWRDHICEHVAMDLRKYRTYKGNSIRDLLRALRNKKNHYRELTIEAQDSLGQIPDKFVSYWLDRFPTLLPHTWEKFESIKSEPIFAKYYSPNYDWAIVDEAEDEYFQNTSKDIGQDNPIERRLETEINTEDGSPQLRQRKDKNFWRSKSQQKYNRWRRGVHHNSVHPENSFQNRLDLAFRPPQPFPASPARYNSPQN